MSKKTTAVIKARRNVLLTASAPALAPARPVEPDEAETAAVRASDPHRVGVDHTHRKLRRTHKRPKGIVAQIAASKQQAKGA